MSFYSWKIELELTQSVDKAANETNAKMKNDGG